MNLIEFGIKQFTILPCSQFSGELLATIQDSRASQDARKDKINDKDSLLILSQDCDIYNSQEKTIEVVRITKAKNKDIISVQLQKAKNTRKLVVNTDGDEFIISKVGEKSIINKSLIEEALSANVEKNVKLQISSLSEKNKNIFMSWLVNRYARRPFPGKFNDILFNQYLRNPKGHALQTLLEENYAEILEFYIFIDPQDDEDAEKYDVSITALLSSSCTDEKEEEIDRTLKGIVKTIHDDDNCLNMIQALDENDSSKWIHEDIINEYVARPKDFSKADEFNYRPLTLDYLCWPDEE
ncbi:hypothetical protein [Rahnella perminowiae]|uniref:hypothetical protein n=1 Tax=Rahnella perminowiae TaxID=2816244 RepID=UPI00215CC1C1|nr:hypothetical protein [Rahnella perminowiae]MCR8999345.1 hypothetical protein [Rahnella perminowiae]